MENQQKAIGLFDSGMGGLSVMREIRALLPHEDLLFVADSGHVPYGPKSPEYVQQRSLAITRFLLEYDVKAIVIACNTATAAAAALLRSRFQVPIIGMEPAVKPAAAATRSGVVGVLATSGTLSSTRFAALLERFGSGITVVTQPAPGFVERVEAGDLTGPETRRLAEEYTAPLLAAGADTLVLGSTHFPHLRPLLSEMLGPDIQLIDTGAAVARHLRHVLEERQLLRQQTGEGSARFWTSGNPIEAQEIVSRLWQHPVQVEPLPEPYN
uniref:Glutamate racemase n=1 Tax=Thermosporothrix sp. COM3 TaxID=2490863 RepID=A0A455SH88_9CHLR|nr:glutamate racemase [Thermosporothrix sp. COM3]